MKTSHPALKYRPRTLRKALTRALAFAEKATNYGACAYEKKGENCIIGSFFTPKQLEYIKRKGWNGYNIVTVAESIGEKNLKAMTGLNIPQAGALQRFFDRDNGKQTLVKSLQELLEGSSTRINETLFLNLDEPIKL